jgi:protein TonB
VPRQTPKSIRIIVEMNREKLCLLPKKLPGLFVVEMEEIMNIQRFKWPMMVAAGLHGALFLGTPDRGGAVEKPTKPAVLPSIPDIERLVEMIDPTESDSPPVGGGPAVPMIVEVAMDAPKDAIFTTPQTETPISKQLVTTDVLSVTPGDGSRKIFIEGVGSICGVISLDRHPRATAQMSPDYPLSLHQQGISGSVTVEFDVDTLGRVVRAEAVSCTRREFAEPALRAVRNWRFEAGKRNGKAVPFRMTVPIEFKIDS